jgi:hypothetical protein
MKEPETKVVKIMHPKDMKHLTASPYSGSKSEDFTQILALQVVNTLRINSKDEHEMNRRMGAALHGMMGVNPKDEVEGMLAAQMVATHSAAMRVMLQLSKSENIPQQDSSGNLAIKLLRTYTAQMEALQRYRGKGQQKMTVEHVHVYDGGQAIVGNVTHPEGGREQMKTEDQPHAKEIIHAPMQEMPCPNKKRKRVPIPRNA